MQKDSNQFTVEQRYNMFLCVFWGCVLLMALIIGSATSLVGCHLTGYWQSQGAVFSIEEARHQREMEKLRVKSD